MAEMRRCFVSCHREFVITCACNADCASLGHATHGKALFLDAVLLQNTMSPVDGTQLVTHLYTIFHNAWLFVICNLFKAPKDA